MENVCQDIQSPRQESSRRAHSYEIITWFEIRLKTVNWIQNWWTNATSSMLFTFSVPPLLQVTATKLLPGSSLRNYKSLKPNSAAYVVIHDGDKTSWFQYQNYFANDILYIINLSDLEHAFLWIRVCKGSKTSKMEEADEVGEKRRNIIGRSKSSRGF